MIYYLSRRCHQNTLRCYLESFGRSIARQLHLLSYEELFSQERIRRGAYIFSDLERLTPEEAEHAALMWRMMNDAGWRVLNHPTQVLRRFQFLRTLHDQGTNHFNVHRLADARHACRFPVFIRGENDHRRNQSGLLHTPAELAEEVERIDAWGLSRENKIICEFCDTADAQGIYRKYGAFIIGDRILARHCFFSDQWCVKGPYLKEPEMMREEQRYVADNPHEEQLRRIFALARVQYGRIDYSMLGDAMQIWEINTNPRTVAEQGGGGPARAAVNHWFAANFRAALTALLAGNGSDPSTPKALSIEPRMPKLSFRAKHFVGRVLRKARAHLLTGRSRQPTH